SASVSPLGGGRPGGPVLHQIPPVAVQVEEDSDGGVPLLPRLFRESHATPLHVVVVPPEVVRLEEQEHPAPVWSPARAACSGDAAFASRSAVPPPGGRTTTHRLLGERAVSSASVKRRRPVKNRTASS